MFTQPRSATVGKPASAGGQRLLTVEELARQFHVSEKTISRWRRRGLSGREVTCDGIRRIGFLHSSVDRFVANNPELVCRGARFCRLTDEEHDQMIQRARSLAQAGECHAGVAGRIAQETGRSLPTVISTLKRFDLKHPETAIFPYNHAPLPAEAKRQIYQEYRRGEPVEVLARRFGRTLPCIRRIINDARVARIMELPLDYMDNEQFAGLCSEAKASEILGPPPENELPTKKPRLPSGLPAYMAGLYVVPLLTREQESHLFRKMNYLKHEASKLRETLDLHQPQGRLMDRVESLFEESVATRQQIISANLRLVVSIAKRYVSQAEDFFELVSDGNLSLISAVEKFDYSRGNRFSTYATWAIIKNFARSIPAVLRHRDRFSTSHSEVFSATEDLRADPHEQEQAQLQRESQVKKILGCLDERELQIVAGRFGLTRGQQPLTLLQVGAAMGVSKERIRQIQTRALGKLRKAAEEVRMDLEMSCTTNTGGDQ